MGWLEKEFLLHERDEEGKLLPIDYPVPELGNRKVTIIPVSRGEVLRMVREIKCVRENKPKDEDEQIGKLWLDFVVRHVVRPKFTEEDLNSSKLVLMDDKSPLGIKRHKDIVDILVDAIYIASGVIGSPEEAEAELKKK